MNFFRRAVRLVVQPKRKDWTTQIFQRCHSARIIGVGDHITGRGNQLRKFAEGVFNILQIFEKVQMIGFHI